MVSWESSLLLYLMDPFHSIHNLTSLYHFILLTWILCWFPCLITTFSTHSNSLPHRISICSSPQAHSRPLFSAYMITGCSLVSTIFSSVQLLSRVWLFATPWTAARQASLSITNSWSLPKPMSIESVMPSSHLILCRPLLLLPHPSQHQGLFQWVNSSHEVAKVLECQLQHQSFQWTPRTDLL